MKNSTRTPRRIESSDSEESEDLPIKCTPIKKTLVIDSDDDHDMSNLSNHLTQLNMDLSNIHDLTNGNQLNILMM
jgi:hypothetical protein